MIHIVNTVITTEASRLVLKLNSEAFGASLLHQLKIPKACCVSFKA